MGKKLQVHQVILIASFFALTLFPFLTKAAGLEFNTALYDVAVASKPSFSLDSYWQGKYQDAYDSYYSTNFGNYPAVVKTYVQLRFHLFSLLSSGKIVLKNGSLIEEGYVREFLKLENAGVPTSAELSDLYDKLDQVKSLLNEQNKDLILLINPGKADFISNEIPLRFLWRATYRTIEADKLGDKLLEWANQNNILSVDGRLIAEDVQNGGIPAFYNGGYHASKPTMFCITQELCNTIKSLGYQIKSIQFSGYATSTTPHSSMDNGKVDCETSTANPDWDFQRNSNLFWYPASDQTYYYPQYSVTTDTNHDLPDIFLVGKSFNRDVQFYLSRAGIGNRVFHCQSGRTYIDANFNVTSWSKIDENTMSQNLSESEIVILEYNEYNTPSSSIYTSLDTLLELLESQAVQPDGISSFSAAVPSPKYTNYVRGFYKANDPTPSEGYYWMMKNGGAINLSTNNRYDCKSIILDCGIPAGSLSAYNGEEVKEQEYVVYINGLKTAAFPVGEERRETMAFDVSGIDAPNGEYCIEIIAPAYFQAKEINSKSTDDRELTLRVYSCSLSSRRVEDLEGGLD